MNLNIHLKNIIDKHSGLPINMDDQIQFHSGRYYVLIGRVVDSNLICFDADYNEIWKLDTRSNLVDTFDPQTMTAHTQSGADLILNDQGQRIKVITER